MEEQIIDFLKTKMSVEEVTGSASTMQVRGQLYPPVGRTVDAIKAYFSGTAYTPLFTQDKGRHVVRFGVFRKPELRQRYWLNILLFVATILSTILAGSLNSGGNPFENVADLLLGVPFSLSIMAILTCHELGHYFVSRREGMVTTLPYFIPMPLHFLGTFGAIIQMRSIVPSRRSLLKVGMSGPIAGFLVALPITLLGIHLSEVRVAPEGEGFLRLGDSLLFWLLAKIVHVEVPAGHDLFLHPVAFAGWLGMFVTAMNLVPVGQLDGGHVAFSLFLRRRRFLYIPIFGVMLALGVLWFGWFVWIIFAFFIARRDPVIQDELTPLSNRERSYALMPLVILIMTFVPQPFAM